MNENLDQIRFIINELYDEFKNEERRLIELHDNDSVRIDEIDHRISVLKKNEDVDYKVFSPRNIVTVNSDKIVELENEKNLLEKELEVTDKQLKYYSEKVTKLEKILGLLNISFSNSSFDFNNDVLYSDNENNDSDPFDELFPLNNAAKSSVNLSDEKVEDSLSSSIDDIISDEDLTSSNTSDISVSDTDLSYTSIQSDNSISKGSIAHIIHRVEFTEKIIVNDSIRAKIEIKEILKMLRDLLK